MVLMKEHASRLCAAATADQALALQRDAFKEARCRKVFPGLCVGGTTGNRSGLDRAMQALKCGDTIVVWRLDRLGRSLLSRHPRG